MLIRYILFSKSIGLIVRSVHIMLIGSSKLPTHQIESLNQFIDKSLQIKQKSKNQTIENDFSVEVSLQHSMIEVPLQQARKIWHERNNWFFFEAIIFKST